MSNPFDQFDAAPPQQKGALPVINDDNSDWNNPAPAANPFDQLDAKAPTPPPAASKGSPVWSSSPLSLAPISQYADGSYGFDSNAGMLGAAKRMGKSALGTIENLPNLYHQVGEQTANNTAEPDTAVSVNALAALTAMRPDVTTTARATIAPAANSALHTAADADYNTLRNMNVHYEPDAAATAMQAQQDALSKTGWSSESAPKTHSILNKLSNPPESAVSTPLTGLMEARSGLGKIGQGADRQDAAAAKNSVRAIDQFIANPSPQSVMAGPAADASAILQRANGNYAAAMRDDKVQGIGDYSQFKSADAHSGANFDNKLRQQISPLFDPRYTARRLSGFTPDEKDAVAQISSGNRVRNGLRFASSYMGGQGGGVAGLESIEGARLGSEWGGPSGAVAGAVMPLVGRALRGVQNNMAQGALDRASTLIRSRAPLSREMQANAPLVNTPATTPAISAVRGAAIQLQPQPQPQPDKTGWGMGVNPQYARGGKVKKPSHEYLVNRLMALAEKAKRAEKKHTAPILNMPDDAVTAALAKAQEAI